MHLTAVKLGTDFGTRVEVLSGLSASDRVVLNPADSLADGDVVTSARQSSKGRVAVARRSSRHPISLCVGTPLWCAASAVAAGCAVGPDYHKPAADVPPAWQPEAPWREAAPNDAALKGDWWRLFQDDALNPLVDRALTGNQNLRVAAARLDQARDDSSPRRRGLISLRGPVRCRGARQEHRRIGRSPHYSVPNQVHGAE